MPLPLMKACPSKARDQVAEGTAADLGPLPEGAGQLECYGSSTARRTKITFIQTPV